MTSNKIKLAILVDKLNQGGMQKIALLQTKALNDLGIDVSLLILRYEEKEKNNFSDLVGELPIQYLDKNWPRFLRFSFKFPLFQFFSLFHVTYPLVLPFCIKKGQYDYIVSHGTYTCFSAITLRIFKGIRFSGFIWDPVTYILERVYKKNLNDLLFSIIKILGLVADKVIFAFSDFILVGGRAHDRLIKSIAQDKKIVLIPPPVGKFSLPRKKKGKFALVSTVWKKGKNPEFIIDLAKKLRQISFVLTGEWIDMKMKQDFSKLVKNNKLKNIKILGSVSELELARLYQAALVLLQTNDDRGFGLSALEAATYGTTFIIPKHQGVCEYFTHGHEGFMTQEQDLKQMVKYLRKFYNHPELAMEMGQKAEHTLKRKFNGQVSARSLLKEIITAIS